MPISNQYYFNQSLPLLQAAEDLQLAILEELRRINNRLIVDPDYDGERRLISFTESELEKYDRESQAWILATLPAAYMRGISVQDSELSRILQNVNQPDSPVPTRQVFSQGGGQISSSARGTIPPKHHTAFGVLEANARQNIRSSFDPILRSSRDMYRASAVQALAPAFRTGDTATRRELSQRVLNELSKRGVAGIVYADGSRRELTSYAEMVGRSAVQRTSQQASLNRLQERGYDLVRVNAYAGASDLCDPWQGRVYSLSGSSDQYPAFEDAQFDGNTGLFHPNCGHAQAPYIPGVSEAIEMSTDPAEEKILRQMGEKRGNRFIYQQSQRQRQIERNIRNFKKRKAVALDPKERARADRFIKKWQGEAREHIKQNPFLRRAYAREQI